MHLEFEVEKKYLWLPVFTQGESSLAEIFVDSEKVFEFEIKTPEVTRENKEPDFFSSISIKDFLNKKMVINCKLPHNCANTVIQSDQPFHCDNTEPLEVHFTPNSGWLNDPNGLVYKDGCYHLYFQYNAFAITWGNMSWGHAVSKDLLHWKQEDTALWPDKNGTMYSGCGLVNERGLLGLPKDCFLYFYTAAGGTNKWSEGKKFTQRLSYSLDQGMTLKKYEDFVIDTIEDENRDPKVFWNEQSKAYFMVLYLKDNDFGLLKSKDLLSWSLLQRFTLDQAWECPDFLEVPIKDSDQKRNIFWSADGFYYFVDFKDERIHIKSEKNKAYANSIPYAAQSYFGLQERVVQIPWLRTRQEGKLYTGAMGLPVELFIVAEDGKEQLGCKPVREYDNLLKKKFQIILPKDSDENGKVTVNTKEKLFEILLVSEAGENTKTEEKNYTIQFNENEIHLDYGNETIIFLDQTISFTGFNLSECRIIIDSDIIEIFGKYGVFHVVFENTKNNSAIAITES